MWIKTYCSESTPPVDFSARFRLDVGPATITRARHPCGKDSDNLSTL